jgi:hypothetical protein
VNSRNTQRILHPLGTLLLFAAIALIAYAPCLTGPFLWDENALTKNPLLQSTRGLWLLWSQPQLNRYEAHYWPLTYTVFWLQYQLWGLNTFGYHVVNVILHACCSFLLWLVLRNLKLRGALLASLLFLVHPIHVESVAWIIELKDVLSCAFALICVLAYLRFCKTGGLTRYVVALASFACALLSKSAVVPLPFCLAILLWWKQRRLDGKSLLPLLPLVIIAAAFAFADTRFAHTNERVEVPLDARIRATIPGPALWLYLLRILAPIRLSPLYPPWHIALQFAAPLLVLFIALIAVLLWNRQRGAAASLTIFALLLLPVLGLVSFAYLRHAYTADRFVYLASAPILVLVAEALLRLRLYLSTASQYALQASILFVLAALTFFQASIWGDELRFWHSVCRTNPNSSLAHGNLGLALMRARQVADAQKQFETSLQLDPQNASSYLNLGAIAERVGLTAQAEQHYLEAIRYKPDYAEAYNNLGLLQARSGRRADAEQSFRKAVEINPLYTNAQKNLDTLSAP